MKRYIRSSEDDNIYNRIVEGASKLTQPEKFHSSSILVKGAYGKKIRLSIGYSHLGYTSTITISDGARYTEDAADFEGAVKAFSKLANKYINYTSRFKDRKLTEREYADLTNGL